MKIQFLGATRGVTGSCYLLETKFTKLLVDCGMFQGVKVEDHNYDHFIFDPQKIDAVFLTHAHLDHCGLLPKLYREGFRGKVYMTAPTRMIIEHMLLDSAKIQELRFRQWKNNDPTWKRESEEFLLREPIYNSVDVLGLLGNSRTVPFEEVEKVEEGVSAQFLRVGHALGAASILLTIDDEGESKKILFSGDIGNSNQLLDTRFDFAKKADVIVMESLYGGREHEAKTGTEKRFVETINKTLQRGGSVVIPAFTLQRSQELLFLLKGYIQEKKIPTNVRVYLDSPLAIKITEIYKKYYTFLNPNIVKNIKNGEELFSSQNFVFIANDRQSKKIRKKHGAIVIAGNGMCAGGRIIYHLLAHLEDKRSSIVFVGFQAEGTPGRKIVDGAQVVSLDGTKVKVKSEIVTLYGFSAHAGNTDLLRWLAKVDQETVKRVFLIHAEEEISNQFKDILTGKGYSAVVPEWKGVYDI